ncbi:OmpA family protein [Cyclobacterium plantarum]|uniref:OmpA family protein n=1 Tax=Cyclobacterium plantarum TaxID=2716263 RepID=A0ABX0H593_9BACT|nr:OmpA family protein [Cyclobacterium plantarum]NHE57014.1 OmpA family protein [Cyclobacterium plantarum]
MKKIFIYFIPVFLFGLLSGSATAQSGLLRYADRKLAEENYFEAGQGYANAYAKNPSFQAAKGAAMAFDVLRDYPKAYNWWEKAVTFAEADDKDWLQYIAAANRAGEKDAVFMALDSLDEEQNGAIRNLQLDSLKYWYGSEGNAGLKRLDRINSSSTEFGWVKDQQGRIYFTSDRGGESDREKKALRIDKSYKYYNKSSDWTGRDFLSIYRMDTAGTVTPFEVPVPGVFHASDPYVLQEQDIIFYTVTRDIRRSKNYEVHSELYFSRLDAAGKPVDFKGLPINAPLEYSIKSPFVDESNKRLYFSSDMSGGHGGFDLYYMTYGENFEFQEPVNLGPVINSAGNEIDPFIQDGKFYFASDGHPGLGGLDIFTSDRNNDTFAGVKNMGLPYNSPQDDFGFFETAENRVLISSNRPESSGWDDIFELESLYKDFQALVLACDGEKVSGALEVSLTEGNDKINIGIDQIGDGMLEAEMAPEQDHEIQIKKQGYFAIQDKDLSTRGLASGSLEKTYQLVRIPYNTAVYVDLVYYNLDESVIRTDAQASLDKVAELLKYYSFLNIVVRSHTDARASEAYNEALSEKRADAVRDYLGKFGVARSRIEAEWLGETELANDCGDGNPCPEDLHQLNRRTELLLLAFPEEGRAYTMPPELQGVDLCDISNIQLPEELPTIYFGFDQAELDVADMMALERVALMLKNMINRRLAIMGHTDNRGSAEYNEALSKERALVVKNYLEGKGIASDRLVYEFFGKTKPVNDCDEQPCSPEMHQLNRRTELILPSIPTPKKNWSRKEGQ